MWKKSKTNKRLEANKNGELRSYHGGWKRYIQPSIKKDKDGYLIFGARNNNGTSTTFRVHRIVAEAWIPNPENKPVVNHINGVKDDNRVENLEWSTISENTQHGYDNLGVLSKASKHIALYINGDLFSTYNSITEMSKIIGLDRNSALKFIENTEGYFAYKEISLEEFDKKHNKNTWINDFKINTRGRYYRIGSIVYDKISDIQEDLNISRDIMYKRIKEGEIVVISLREFLEKTQYKNW